jgi:hypothetical protein
MKKFALTVIVSLALGFTSMSVAKAEIVTFPCGGSTYKVDMPSGILVDGKDCTGALVIDSSVKEIKSRAFALSKLTSVVIPNSVRMIGESAFTSTGSLKSVVLSSSITKIETFTFSGGKLSAIVIPQGVQIIGSYAFSDNEITSLVIPESVVSVEMGAFARNKIGSLNLGKSLTKIGDTAFYSNNLVSVDIPDSVTRFGYSAFGENPTLRTIIFCGTPARDFPTSPTCPPERRAIVDAIAKVAADKAAADKAAADKAAANKAAAERLAQDAKKLTINCVKGNSNRKVVGENPQCPKGFTNPMAKYLTYQAYAKCKLFKKDYILAGAQLRDNGATLILSGVKEFRYDISALVETDLNCATAIIKMPAFVDAKIGSTRAIDGMQTAQWGKLSAFWNYHPDSGLNITFNSK